MVRKEGWRSSFASGMDPIAALGVATSSAGGSGPKQAAFGGSPSAAKDFLSPEGAQAARFWDRLGVMTYEHPIRFVYGGALDYISDCSPALRRAIISSVPPEFSPLVDWPQIMRRDGAHIEAVLRAQQVISDILEVSDILRRPE